MKQAIVLIIVIAVFGIIMTAAIPAQARDVPFTQEDRDRIIRTETKVDALEKSVNQRFEQVDKRFEQVDKRLDQIFAIMLGGFGVLFSGMGTLIGFVLWDRRTALAPAIRKTKEVEEQTELIKKTLETRAELIEKALKEASANNPSLKDALKHVGLL
jgi:hypothetical protein